MLVEVFYQHFLKWVQKMKIFVISDIHGSYTCLEQFMKIYDEENEETDDDSIVIEKEEIAPKTVYRVYGVDESELGKR